MLEGCDSDLQRNQKIVSDNIWDAIKVMYFIPNVHLHCTSDLLGRFSTAHLQNEGGAHLPVGTQLHCGQRPGGGPYSEAGCG